MLIEFSVQNFRSFKERQTLSLVASNTDKDLPDHLIDPQAPGLSNTKLLKSVAIYGANASGKSNLYKAAAFMRDFVIKSATEIKPGEETGVVPFRLNPDWEKKPSEFEMIFIQDGIRYQYGFSLDKKRVYEEWLTAYPQGLPQRWFSRVWDSEKNEYEWKFGSYLKGGKESLKEKTKENTLFLSTAAQFNHDQLSIVYNWFQTQFVAFEFYGYALSPLDAAQRISEDVSLRELIIFLLQQADLGVSDILIKKINPDDISFPQGMPDEIKSKILNDIKSGKLVDFKLAHKSKLNDITVEMDIDDESSGTQKLLTLSVPWLESLRNGDVIFLDEIGAYLHPLLVLNLLKMINNDSNKNGAQLIFTTHDTTLLNSKTLRRDQIWFTEKNEEGATILYPLTDYQVRRDESLQKGYLAGRYGAIPFLGDFTF